MTYSDLDALTASRTRSGIEPTGETIELPLDHIYPNPDQPRKHFDPDALQGLADSILEHGLIEPIVVAPNEIDGTYMIVAGERRWRAHRLADIPFIKASVIEIDDEGIEVIALLENIQREDLTDFEIAVHVGKLWSSGRYGAKWELAENLGKSPSWLSKVFGALRLDPEITADLEEARRDVPLSVLEELGRVKDKAAQREAYRQYTAGEITRDDIKSFKPAQKQKQEKPQKLKPIVVSGNWQNKDGIDAVNIIQVANIIGIKLPPIFSDPEITQKKFKITIEEL